MTPHSDHPGNIVVAVHDGFYGSGTGAGNSNRAFLTILANTIAASVPLAVLPVLLRPGSTEYDPAWHQETLALLANTHSNVIPVDNGSDGMTRFGGLGCFHAACASAAASIAGVLPCLSRALIIAFDVPFFGLAPLLRPYARAALVNVARSTAALQAPHDSQRITWECRGLQTTAATGGHIAATSRHIREHLATVYRIPQPAIRDLTNGLAHAEQHPSPARGTGMLPPAATAGFLLSFGRAEPYKGFDDLLDALRILKASQPQIPHTVLAAVTDGPPLTSYQRHLAHRITTEELDVTLRTTFSPGIRGLLSHPSLAAVIIPSRAEPFGRIPLEAYIAGASPVIATTAGGLAETVIDGHTGYTASPANPLSLAEALRKALAASPAEHARMLAAGRRLSATCHDYDTNVRAFLSALAPWALASGQST